jgi:hypothetical protein
MSSRGGFFALLNLMGLSWRDQLCKIFIHVMVIIHSSFFVLGSSFYAWEHVHQTFGKTLAALELFDTANLFMGVSIKHAFLHSSQFMKPAC